MNKIMIILAGFVLLASACTSKQVTEKTHYLIKRRCFLCYILIQECCLDLFIA